MNLRAAVERRNAQIGILEADLAARQQREAFLSARLKDALASIDPNVPKLHADIAAYDEQLRELKHELDQARGLVQEKDADLQVAEESIRNLEIELRDKTGKLDEASVTVEEWRAVIAESQRSILQRDGRIQQLEADLQKRSPPWWIRRATPAKRSRSKGRRVCSFAPTAIPISSTCWVGARASAAARTTNWCSTPNT